jgi:hypothetical protein
MLLNLGAAHLRSLRGGPRDGERPRGAGRSVRLESDVKWGSQLLPHARPTTRFSPFIMF